MKILNVSDIHLTMNRPIARKDEDWLQAQQDIADWIVDKAIELKVDLVLDCGDTFDTSVQHHSIINIIPKALQGKNMKWVSMMGNHSLQYHQVKNYEKSSMSTLNFCENVEILECSDNFESEYKGIQLIHRLVLEKEGKLSDLLDKNNKTYDLAEDLLDDYPHSNLILCGDFHHGFILEKDGRYVVNVGNAIRHSAKMIGIQPKCMYLDYDENNDKLLSYEWIDIPDKDEMLSNEHLTLVKQNEEQWDTFLETIKAQENLTLDFWDNMEAYLLENEIHELTKEKVYLIKDECQST